jgi:putative hydrolase of the HAD superfamily
LIIFDLDDTLIDTSGSVTPFKMRACLRHFEAMGLPMADFEQCYQELLAINDRSAKSKEALTHFVRQKGGDPALVEGAMAEMVSPLPDGFPIATTPYAKEILHILAPKHTLALVTGGHPPFQLEKLEKAGIDRGFFSNIAIPEDSVKKPFYQGLLAKFSMAPRNALVCGDRIAMDLAPAHELGLTTVHMRWGRGKQGKTEPWIDYSIADLSELKRIVNV